MRGARPRVPFLALCLFDQRCGLALPPDLSRSFRQTRAKAPSRNPAPHYGPERFHWHPVSEGMTDTQPLLGSDGWSNEPSALPRAATASTRRGTHGPMQRIDRSCKNSAHPRHVHTPIAVKVLSIAPGLARGGSQRPIGPRKAYPRYKPGPTKSGPCEPRRSPVLSPGDGVRRINV